MDISLPKDDIPSHAFGFGEDQGRYIVCVKAAQSDKILANAKKAGVSIQLMGVVRGSSLDVADCFTISIVELAQTHAAWMPNFMAT